MINNKDQEQLFELISNYLTRDIECFAIGGTAMMFYGYKNLTKDIDLVFKDKKDRDSFIGAIKELGYKEKSIKGIYPQEKENLVGKPLMFTRGDERFDLFLKNVFGFELGDDILKDIKQKHEFLGKKELILNILPEEYIVLLKAITNREKDFDDIVKIIEKNKDIDWKIIIDIAINQKNNKPWILIDLEETMQKLKELIFLPSKYFDMVYKAQN